MTTPFWCVLVAYLLIYVPRFLVARGQARRPEGYDNTDPRDQQARLEGKVRRALGAHTNGFEAFPAFAAAVIIAHIAGADPGYSAILAIVHVVARAVYLFAYVGGFGTLRSLVWTAGFAGTLGLFILAALA